MVGARASTAFGDTCQFFFLAARNPCPARTPCLNSQVPLPAETSLIASAESKVEEITKILGEITTDEPGGLDDYFTRDDDDDDDNAGAGGPSGPMGAGAWDSASYEGYGYGSKDAYSQYV